VDVTLLWTTFFTSADITIDMLGVRTTIVGTIRTNRRKVPEELKKIDSVNNTHHCFAFIINSQWLVMYLRRAKP